MLPGATGVLGIVGVTDRGPVDPTPIGSVGELVELFGPGQPVHDARAPHRPRQRRAEGVGRAHPRPAGAGGPASPSPTPTASPWSPSSRGPRAAWGNQLQVRATPVLTLDRSGVKYLNLEVLWRRSGRRSPRQPGDGPGEPELPLRPGERGLEPGRGDRPPCSRPPSRRRWPAPSSPRPTPVPPSPTSRRARPTRCGSRRQARGPGRQPPVRAGRRRARHPHPHGSRRRAEPRRRGPRRPGRTGPRSASRCSRRDPAR